VVGFKSDQGLCDRFALAGSTTGRLISTTQGGDYHDTDAAAKEMNSLDFMDPPRRPSRARAISWQDGANAVLTGFCLCGA